MESFKIFFNNGFFTFEDYSSEKLSKIKDLEDYVAKKTPKKGHFMDAELVLKTLKIYNLTTINATLIKLTRIMYLHKVFLFTNTWGVTRKLWN